MFIGGFEHVPNIDAVLYFARDIFPLVRSRIPEAVFQVIGPDPTPEIRDLASPEIEVLGYVPDVTPYFDQARLSVAPLRYGAGVKGKVNQSMALGVPTVVTSVAAEGMYLVHEQNTMIADDPERFAEAVVKLWNSPELWHRIADNGRQNLREHFSVEAAARASGRASGMVRPLSPESSREGKRSSRSRPLLIDRGGTAVFGIYRYGLAFCVAISHLWAGMVLVPRPTPSGASTVSADTS